MGTSRITHGPIWESRFSHEIEFKADAIDTPERSSARDLCFKWQLATVKCIVIVVLSSFVFRRSRSRSIKGDDQVESLIFMNADERRHQSCDTVRRISMYANQKTSRC